MSELDCLNVGVTVLCERDSWVALLVGPRGETIRAVTLAANQDIRNAFQRDVYLRLAVRTLKAK